MFGKLTLPQRLTLIAALAALAIGLVVGSMYYSTRQYEGLLSYLIEQDLPNQEKVAVAYIEFAAINGELFKLLESNQDKTHDNGEIYRRGRLLVDRLERLEQSASKQHFGLTANEAEQMPELIDGMAEYKNTVIMTLEMVLADRDLTLLYSSKIGNRFNRVNDAFIRMQENVRADITKDIRDDSKAIRSQLLLINVITALLVTSLVGLFLRISLRLARQHRYLANSLDRLRRGDTEEGSDRPIEDPAFSPLQAALDAFRKSLRNLRASEHGLAEKNQALEQKALELAEARNAALHASEVKSQFLSTVSHELRTPMNGFIGMTQLLAGTPLDEEQREMLDISMQSAQNLHKLIEGILDYSNIERGQFASQALPFELEQTVEAIAADHREAAAAKQLELYCAIDHGLPGRVIGDPTRLRQILDNLLDNAIKFTHDGKIALVVTAGERPFIRFTVHDSGIGISDEDQGRIFTLFAQGDGSTTRKYSGLGLGLTMTKQLVRHLGGNLRLESQLGQGTTFHVELPLPAEVESSRRADMAPAKHAADGKHRILVVEDNAMNRSLAKAMLTRLGHDCRFAENGQEALHRLKKEDFDLVMMDCQMPVMDGYETAHTIRQGELKTGGHIPILAVTANAMSGDRERSLESGMDDYLSKPYTLEQLGEKIDRLLGRSPAN